MFKNQSLTRKVANKIKRASDYALEELKSDRVEQEPSFTDRLLAAISYELNGREISGVLWQAKTLTDRGPNAQEKRYGADFIGVFDINLPGYQVQKGFLAQAKLVEPGDYFPPSESSRLKSQCDEMLRLTPESYVFVYSRMEGVLVVPAISILGARDCNPHELTTKSIRDFYIDHFECFVGDRRIHQANIERLDILLKEYHAKHVLFLSGTSLIEPRYT